MNFEKTVLLGLQRKLKSVFEVEPRFISHGNRLRLVSFLQKVAGGVNNSGVAAEAITYPVLLLFPRSMTWNRQAYSTVSLQRRPLLSAPSTGTGNDAVAQTGLVREHKLVPTQFEFEFIHITPDFWVMLEFASMCVRSGANQSMLSFQIEYDGIPIDIRVAVDETIQIPEKDASIEQTDWYETTARLVVSAYVSEPLASVLERQVPVITDVNISVHGGASP